MTISIKAKKIIKRIFNFFGLEIKLRRTEKEKAKIKFENFLSSHKWLTDYNFKTILDIGANEGQFAHKMRKLFPKAQIISFEPLPREYQTLCESFQHDKKFVAYNFALGEKEESTTMWLNEFSPSSSLLKMKEHTKHFDYAISQTPIDIKIFPLDQALKMSAIGAPYLIKIDVQGYEEYVIKGGKNIFSNATMVITEVSFSQLYENHMLFDGIYLILNDLGFRFIGNYEQMNSPINNEVLQADAIFVKA